MNATARPIVGWVMVTLMGAFSTAPAAAALGFGGFLENIGQFDDAVLFKTSSSDQLLYFTSEGLVLDVFETLEGEEIQGEEALLGIGRVERPPQRRGCVIRILFDGAARSPAVEGRTQQGGLYNFLLGGDPSGWHTGARTFEEILYRDVWPGIDLLFRAAPGQLQYDAVIRPGADPSLIRFAYEGVELVTHESGSVRLATPVKAIVHRLPVSGQGGALVFDETGRNGPTPRSSFSVDWCTFLEGSHVEESNAITVDAQGRPVVGGRTASDDFPTTAGVYDSTLAGINYYDGFVAKLEADGRSPVWATYLGGASHEWVHVLLPDADGNIVTVGGTQSADFPTTPGAFDETPSNPSRDWDAFVTKLSADGTSLVWSTYLGRGKDDWAVGAVLDPQENVTVVGHTFSPTFPTTPGAYKEVHSGDPYRDAFITKLAANGESLVWSTLLGSDDASDYGLTVALDALGNAVVGGGAESDLFPTTAGAYDEVHNGDVDGYLAKLSADGSSLVWSTFVGGSSFDFLSGLELAQTTEDVIVVGRTTSSDFPTTAGAFDRSFNGPYLDACVLRMSANGSSLIWSTYLGGTGSTGANPGDWSWDLDLGPLDSPLVTGSTTSDDFPTTPGAPHPTRCGGPNDGFITWLENDGSSLLWSTYVGGSTDTAQWEGFLGYENIEVVGDRCFLAGGAKSDDFPVGPAGVWDMVLDGVSAGVVMMVRSPAVPVPETPQLVSDPRLVCSPNPFRHDTEICYFLRETASVQVSVYDAAGRLVRTVRSTDEAKAGIHRVPWDGRNNAGLSVAGGVYFIRLKTADRDDQQRVVLIR